MALWRLPALCKPRHLPKYAFAHLLLLSSSISSITYHQYHNLALNDYAEFLSSPIQVSWHKNGELLPPNKIVVERQGNRHSLLIEQVDLPKTPKKADGQLKILAFF